ncbi:hypothetical protein TWF281_004398 [Arthrobotrys megalospora]
MENALYPHPTEILAQPLLYREQYLRNFSARLREEINWTEKIINRSFVATKLKEVAVRDGLLFGKRIHVWCKEDIDYVYKELMERYKPYVEECNNRIQPSIDGVWRIDEFIDESLRHQLINAARSLEDNPEKKWHSESNEQLLDLVHPSYWPIIYGRSKTVDGKIITFDVPRAFEIHPRYRYSNSDSDFRYSKKFCWLPSEFEISQTGEAKITSYINNLALPEQQRIFYPILEKIFSKFVPLFNHVLADLRRETHNLTRVEHQNYEQRKSDNRRLAEDGYTKTYDELLAQFERGEKLTMDAKYGPRAPRSRLLRFFSFSKGVQILERGRFSGSIWQAPSQNLLQKVKLEGTTAKVIVKMATIILTPKKPRWKGGPWHIEALKNEGIVATGILYYDQENITPSSLAFRRALDDMDIYDGELQELSELYNLKLREDRSTAQEIGSIATKANRAIAFPNIFQHRIEPFELIDRKRNGYRRILAFFLCDPSGLHEIPTTRTVPPQQPDVREATIDVLRKTGARNLPVELFQMITQDLPPTISREEAEKYMKELMEERTKFTGESLTVNGARIRIRGYSFITTLFKPPQAYVLYRPSKRLARVYAYTDANPSLKDTDCSLDESQLAPNHERSVVLPFQILANGETFSRRVGVNETNQDISPKAQHS